MDSIREDLKYFPSKSDSLYRKLRSPQELVEEREEVDEIRENVRHAMQGARRKMANLRNDAEEKDKLLTQEQRLRQQLERELSNKSEELLREKSRNLRSSTGVERKSHEGRYSPLNYTLDYGGSGYLKDELDESKALNFQLTERLADADAEIQATRMTRDDLLTKAESKIAAQGAALIDKIYRAQKERDYAVNGRLQLAKDEKEDLLARMRRLEKEQAGFDSGVDSVYDDEDADQVSKISECKCDYEHVDPSWEELALNDIKSIKELLNRITASQSPRSIDKQGTIMADKIKTVQKTHQRAMAEELKSVMEERDEAVCKVKSLEEEVAKLRKELEMIKNQFKLAEKHRVKSTQAQLLSSQHERDASFRKTKRLEDELETIRVYYSLHHSLSQEQNLRDQFNCTMDSFEDRLRSRESELVLAQRSYDDLVTKLRSVSTERNTLASQLQESNKNFQQEKQKADKLERLVGVLRKRVQAGAASVETIN